MYSHWNKACLGREGVTLSEHVDRFAVILNPSKNGADKIRTAFKQAVLAAGGEEPGFFETTVQDPGHQMTLDALAAGYNVIVAAGGDGTVREVAEVLAQPDIFDREDDIDMAILPLGTGNLLARNLEMNVDDLREGIDWAINGSTRAMDAVKVDLERVTGEIDEHVFLVMGGVGIDAEVMGDTRADLKKKVGPLAYVEAAFRKIKGSNHPVGFRIGDHAWEKRSVQSIVFANCGKLQGGLEFIPKAKLDDGLLDVVVMTPRSPLDWARIFVKTLARAKKRIPVIDFFQNQTFAIRTAEPILAQLDGDTVGEVISVQGKILPGSINIRVGEGRKWPGVLGTVFKR